ncbi:MAG TPA: hypothetical protein VK121_02530 [Pseudogracilibacillus sp.]|nr:hypothetical protein [Pseudogracilibacillus sp.]
MANQEDLFEEYKFSKFHVKMTAVYLEEVQVTKKRDISPEHYTNNIHFATKVETLNSNKTKGYLKTTVQGVHNETGSEDLEIVIVYSGEFESKTIQDEELKELTEHQIVPQLLSFNRSMIAQLTSEMHIQRILLPTIDVVKSLHNNADKNGEDV